MDLGKPRRKIAIFRWVPNSYAAATTLAVSKGAIDVAQAARQHAVYVQEVVRLGYEPMWVDVENTSPDSVFIEDTVTVAAGHALIHRLGHPGRRCETIGLRGVLRRCGIADAAVREMAAPATADGGDILLVRDTLYVGMSARTNLAGLELIRREFEPRGLNVRAVELPPGVLHLKCVCSMADEAHLVLAEDTIDADVFGQDIAIVSVPYSERYAANVVGANQRVIIAAGFPEMRVGLGTMALTWSRLICLSFAREMAR